MGDCFDDVLDERIRAKKVGRRVVTIIGDEHLLVVHGYVQAGYIYALTLRAGGKVFAPSAPVPCPQIAAFELCGEPQGFGLALRRQRPLAPDTKGVQIPKTRGEQEPGTSLVLGRLEAQ